MFHSLANLPTDYNTIVKMFTKKSKRNTITSTPVIAIAETPSMEGSTPALPAEPGTLNATLPDTPGKKDFQYSTNTLGTVKTLLN